MKEFIDVLEEYGEFLEDKIEINEDFHHGTLRCDIPIVFRINGVSYYVISFKKLTSDKTIIEALIGAMVINKLMRDRSTVWKIYEQFYRSIYDVSKFTKMYDKKRIEVHTGFTFRPRVLSSNKIGFFIDCKSKMFYVKTLKEKYMLNLIKNAKKSEEKYLIDFCPIPDCIEKSNPFSLCRLSVPSTGRQFFDENKIKTRATVLKKEIEDDTENENSWNVDDIEDVNLIDYHNQNHICPLGILGNELDPELNSIKVQMGNNFYDYPPERLRPRASFDRIPKRDRNELIGSMMLPPTRRFKKTSDYIELVRRLEYKDKNLKFISKNPIYHQKERFIGKTKHLSKFNLLLHKDEESFVPAFDIYNTKPWDYETRDEMNKLCLYFLVLGDLRDQELRKLRKFDWKKEITNIFH